MSHVWVEVNIDEVDTRDLIRELENRALDEDEQRKLFACLKSSPAYEDGRKMELFLKVINRYSLMEFEEMFKEKFEKVKAPKEQLFLNIEP